MNLYINHKSDLDVIELSETLKAVKQYGGNIQSVFLPSVSNHINADIIKNILECIAKTGTVSTLCEFDEFPKDNNEIFVFILNMLVVAEKLRSQSLCWVFMQKMFLLFTGVKLNIDKTFNEKMKRYTINTIIDTLCNETLFASGTIPLSTPSSRSFVFQQQICDFYIYQLKETHNGCWSLWQYNILEIVLDNPVCLYTFNLKTIALSQVRHVTLNDNVLVIETDNTVFVYNMNNADDGFKSYQIIPSPCGGLPNTICKIKSYVWAFNKSDELPIRPLYRSHITSKYNAEEHGAFLGKVKKKPDEWILHPNAPVISSTIVSYKKTKSLCVKFNFASGIEKILQCKNAKTLNDMILLPYGDFYEHYLCIERQCAHIYCATHQSTFDINFETKLDFIVCNLGDKRYTVLQSIKRDLPISRILENDLGKMIHVSKTYLAIKDTYMVMYIPNNGHGTIHVFTAINGLISGEPYITFKTLLPFEYCTRLMISADSENKMISMETANHLLIMKHTGCFRSMYDAKTFPAIYNRILDNSPCITGTCNVTVNEYTSC